MKPLFEEKQRYSQWWLWVIIVAGAAIGIGIFLYGIYEQLVMGRPWGTKPMSDDALIINSFITITALTVMLIIFFNSVLEVVVDKSALTYRYFPLIRSWKRVEKETIQSFEEKTFYLSGYGVKIDLRGNRSLTVKGHTAVEITLLDGKKLLIGTQKSGDFLNALNKMKKGRVD